MNRAVFVDRDGVLNELVPDRDSGEPESPLSVEQVRLLPGAAEGLRRLAQAGYLLVGVSNQPAAAKGKVTLGELEAVQERVLELLRAEGVCFDQFRVCWHHPDGVLPALAVRCDCRKPAPGMLLAAIDELEIDPQRSWMIGDSDSDVAAATAAGVRSVLLEHPHSAHRRPGTFVADARAPDLATAAARVVGDRD